MSLINLKNVSKFYQNKNSVSTGFTRVNLEFNLGEFVVITGESGSGKSTLLNVISGLDSYEEGEMYINGEETSHYRQEDYEEYRRKYIGNIFQHFNLVNSYTVYQNIELILLLNGYTSKEAKPIVLDIINKVGLNKLKNKKAAKLSGGQKQRVAIARALAKDTPIIVADEPTGNLDVKSAKSIMKLLHDISKEKLVIIVTHNYEQAEEYASRKLSMNDGKITEDKVITRPEEKTLHLKEYNDLTFFSKVKLGIRNAFNVGTKFIFLMIIYLFLTVIVFTLYSSFKSDAKSLDDMGENYNFVDTSINRVILNKKDGTSITDGDLEVLNALDNVDEVIKYDFSLDNYMNLDSYEPYYFWFYGSTYSISLIDEVDEGRLSEADNEIVILISTESYMAYEDPEEILNAEYTNDEGDKYKVVGLIYDDDYEEYYQAKIYVQDTVLEEINENNLKYTTSISLSTEKYTFDEDGSLYYKIEKNDNVPEGYAYVFSELDYYCTNYTCLNKTITLDAENLYYSESIDLKVNNVISSSNFKTLTGLSNYEDYTNTIFINRSDYDKLYKKDIYQISLYLSDTDNIDEIKSTLELLGYNTYFMKDLRVNLSEEYSTLLLTIEAILYAVALLVVFFVCYVVIKIVLKSRNIYYATIRILGANKKVSKDLLNIELLTDINVAYLIFISLIILVCVGVFKIEYIKNLVSYLNLIDYIIVYIILVIMSLTISNKYARKLFVSSAMKTYREEE